MIAAESCHRSSTVAEGNPVIRIHDGHLIDNTRYANRHKIHEQTQDDACQDDEPAKSRMDNQTRSRTGLRRRPETVRLGIQRSRAFEMGSGLFKEQDRICAKP